jgi:magnesium chelatase subunit D
MNTPTGPRPPCGDAAMVAALLAVDPGGLGGIVLRARHGPGRDAWIDRLRAVLPDEAPMVRLGCAVPDDRLDGEIDIAATLRTGRSVRRQGLLRAAQGGVLLVAMAERLDIRRAARIGAALDTLPGTADPAAALLAVALDEGLDPEEGTPGVLADRMAFQLTEPDLLDDGPDCDPETRRLIAAARGACGRVAATPAQIEALCGTALALGIGSLRAPLQALRAARAAAALEGRDAVGDADLELAARLVLAHRATVLPQAPEQAEPEPPAPSQQADPGEAGRPEQTGDGETADGSADRLVEAVQAHLPRYLLDGVAGTQALRVGRAGRAGGRRRGLERGRPVGARKGEPRDGARLALMATLQAAIGWQRIRREERPPRADEPSRILLRRDDLHVMRCETRSAGTVVFAVDASGSQALHRLGEAKGAIELLLADCYRRRDEVALVTFRRTEATMALPPTRSLARAKRELARLAGGGGTPLACGIDAALGLADRARRAGRDCTLVLLTDGRANIDRAGQPGRPAAMRDALAAASRVKAARVSSILIDTSPRVASAARDLAVAAGAHYVQLPHADANGLSEAVRAVVKTR